MLYPSATNAMATPIKKFLLGEFFMNVGRGYLLVLFIQLLFRESGALWHNLIFILSEVLFSFAVPLVAGIWVDRHGPGRLLTLSASGMGLLAIVSAAMASIFPLSVNIILAISIISNMLNAAIRLGVFTLTPALTAHNGLIQINGRQQVAFQGGNLLGVLSAGLLIDHLPIAYSFCLVCLMMLGAVYGYAGATSGSQKPDVAVPRHRFFTLVPLLWRSPMLIMLIVLGASDLVAINVFNLMLPILTDRYFHGQSTAFSIMDACFTVGAILMGWYTGRRAIKGRKLHRYLLLMPLALIVAVSQIAFFNAALCFVAMLILGFLVASYSVYFSAAIQALIPPTLRGRFAALRRMISTLLVMVATSLFTFSFQHFGAQGAIVVSTALSLLILACGLFWMRYRQRKISRQEDDYHDLRLLTLPFEKLVNTPSKESVNV